MPGTIAKRGDVYRATPQVVIGGDAHDGPRPMVCVAELPTDDFVWRAMSRTTSAFDSSVDLFSRADAGLGLSKDGWWSVRYLRSVKKRWTGHATECPFVATLPEPLKTDVLNHYKRRPGSVVGV
jgi:hypothetical protein